mmetsp:Transcript_74850/g.206412  ORF Transcript_74850/g.206412 Transcript_74850/m.206412 type:complete len:231 (-) Transcript_74850:701-1393(-)
MDTRSSPARCPKSRSSFSASWSRPCSRPEMQATKSALPTTPSWSLSAAEKQSSTDSFFVEMWSFSAFTTSTESDSSSIFSTLAKCPRPRNTMSSTCCNRDSMAVALSPNCLVSACTNGAKASSESPPSASICLRTAAASSLAACSCASASSKASATFSTTLRSSTTRGCTFSSALATSGSSSVRESVTLLTSACSAAFFSCRIFARSSASRCRSREASSSRAMPTTTRRR